MDGTPAAKAKLEASATRARAWLYGTMVLFVLLPWLIFLLRSARRR